MKYGIGHINEILAGELLQFRRDDRIEQLLTDSRRLIFPETSLFFSLKGPRRSGASFVEELYKRGVRNFVVQDAPELERLTDANIIRVPDSLAALQGLAAFHRQQFNIPVIGITGSNGKTIVKEWLNQLIEADYQVVRSPKSYNSQIGVPLSVWQLNETHELGIFEAGISATGEMNRLEAMIRPTIGIFTNIGEAHSEGFSDLAAKAAEKLRLFKSANLLIYSQDQPETAKAIELFKQTASPRLFSWGRAASCDLRILSIDRNDSTTLVKVCYQGQEFLLPIPFTDEASVENILHCVCVLLYLGQAGESIARKLQALAPIAMRLELKGGINHCSIINDSYSADLSSLTIALDFLAQQQQHSRRTVILSDFLESGLEAEKLYTTIALALAGRNIDRLVGIGPVISAHADLIAQWYPGQTTYFPSVTQFKNEWHRLHFRDETILLKGARIFEFEEIDRFLSEQIHQTVMEVDLNAMAANLREYRKLLQPGTRVMTMVKAFAYGSGSFEIANLLQYHGVDYLGVAYADEAVALRKGGIRVPIMVMNTENSSYDLLVEYNLEPVIYSMGLLHAFDRWLKKQGVFGFPVHIEIETGMNRLGFPLGELEELVAAVSKSAFHVQSVFSHLAASEEAQQDAFTTRQGELYMVAAKRFQDALPYPFLRHIVNSAGIVRRPDLQLDMVRLGIGLYGIDSAESDIPELKEVSTLKTTIAQIKRLHEGETVGYNRKGVAGPGTMIATVRIGYADGYSRRFGWGVGKMWIKGRLAPTIGTVAMDMTMIDITGIPGVKEGDEVVVFGNELSVRQLARWAQTIPYEILTSVSQRVRRVYFEE